MTDLRVLWKYAVPHRAALGVGLALMLVESLTALGVPWAAGRFADALLSDQPTRPAVQAVLLGLLGLFAAQALVRLVNLYLLDRVADRIIADLKMRLYDHLQSLPLSFFHRRRLGDALALLTMDVHAVGGFVSGTALAVVPLGLTAAGAIVLMFGIRADLALLATVLVPLFYLAMKIAGRKLRPLSRQLQDAHAGAVGIAEENLGMLPALKSFTRERLESARFRDQLDLMLSLSERQRRIHAALGPLTQFLAAASLVLVLWIASREILGARLTAAELVSFLLYVQLLTRPMAGLADLYGQTQSVRGALSRLQETMSERPEREGAAALPLQIRGEIVLENVSFAYPERPPALTGVDLTVRAGETVALVGPNGAGKSTIAHLLMRLHEPASGRLTIDGIDVADVSLPSLRRNIGLVPQHVLLFHASVRENIAYGMPASTPAAIEAAARAARAHDFIMALPEGYDTVIGDRGVRLSGGQQQRIALARALLKDPPILVLDEATAMFDPQGEIEFLESCRDTLKKRTVILITHRPASLSIADRIVRLEGGRVVEDQAFSSADAAAVRRSRAARD